MPRYEFHCVADGVSGGPPATDNLDRALLETASWVGSHWDIWDTVESKYVPGIQCEEEEAEVRARYEARLEEWQSGTEADIGNINWPPGQAASPRIQAEREDS